MLKKSRGQDEVLPLLNLRCINWTTVVFFAACDLRFERFGLPMLYMSRHGDASHRDTWLRKGRSYSAITTDDFISRTSMTRDLSSKIGSVATERCPQRDGRLNILLGQRSRVDVSVLETHSYPHVSCFRSQMYQALAWTSCSVTPEVWYGLAELAARILYRQTRFLQRKSTTGCLCSFSSGRCPPTVPVIIDTGFTGKRYS